jgi:TPR repeat protein
MKNSPKLMPYYLAILLGAALPSVTAAPVFAQSPSEPECLAGNAESCFYVAADYAQGKAVDRDFLMAQSFFLKACEGGIPDGCHYAADMSYAGQWEVPINKPRAINYRQKACEMGHEDACTRLLTELAYDDELQDVPRLIKTYETGCKNRPSCLEACSLGARITYDGLGGNYPDFIDYTRAGPLAARSCDGDPNGECIIAENTHANPSSPAFDPRLAFKYVTINCEANSGASCGNLGRIYQDIEEFALSATYYEKACALDRDSFCPSAKDMRRYVTEVSERDARIAARQARIDQFLNTGDYAGAVNVALRELKSGDHAKQAAMATINANAMGSIATQDLYVLASWFRDGPIRNAADAEMARRGTGLEGTFGTGTNAPGMADKRYRDLYGSSMPSRATSSGTSSSTPPMKSSSQITADVRKKYRSAHCTMNNNANRNLCS